MGESSASQSTVKRKLVVDMRAWSLLVECRVKVLFFRGGEFGLNSKSSSHSSKNA